MLFGKMSEQDMIKFLSVQELLREINSTWYQYKEYIYFPTRNQLTNKQTAKKLAAAAGNFFPSPPPPSSSSPPPPSVSFLLFDIYRYFNKLFLVFSLVTVCYRYDFYYYC